MLNISAKPFQYRFTQSMKLPARNDDAVNTRTNDLGNPAGVACYAAAPCRHGFQQCIGHTVPKGRLQVYVAELQVKVDIGRCRQLSSHEDAILLEGAGTD